MQYYIGTKILKAKRMNLGDYNKYRGWVIPKDEDPTREGRLVEYEDGYESWSPEKAFEAYRRTDGMNFGLAIEAMKKGEKVARAGWNGKGMCVYFVNGTIVPIKLLRGNCAKVIACKDTENESQTQRICGHIDMLAADGSIVVGWLASQTDMLSDDWVIV